eukprot:1928393-Amphidinium_carterae.2
MLQYLQYSLLRDTAESHHEWTNCLSLGGIWLKILRDLSRQCHTDIANTCVLHLHVVRVSGLCCGTPVLAIPVTCDCGVPFRSSLGERKLALH